MKLAFPLLLLSLWVLPHLPLRASEADAKDGVEAEKTEGVLVSQATLDGYVGTYRISPAIALKVWREGEHLMLQATGQAAHKLIGESESVFRVPRMAAKVSFGFNAAGDADHLVLEQDGNEFKAIRE